MNRLSNKNALVTGGTSGIGLETARELLTEGARVAITGRNPKALEAARKELGDKLLVIASDAGDVPGQKKVPETIRQEFGRLDILFLNAGIVEMSPLEGWGGRVRSLVQHQLQGPLFPHPVPLARLQQSRFDRAHDLDQLAHRDAEFKRLRGHERCLAFPRAHTLWGIDLARHSS